MTSATDHFTLFAVLRRDPHAEASTGPSLAEVAGSLESLRGIYDVSGLRADADLMLWLTGHSARGPAGGPAPAAPHAPSCSPLLPTWNALGVHRDAEFSRDHVPAFIARARTRRRG